MLRLWYAQLHLYHRCAVLLSTEKHVPQIHGFRHLPSVLPGRNLIGHFYDHGKPRPDPLVLHRIHRFQNLVHDLLSCRLCNDVHFDSFLLGDQFPNSSYILLPGLIYFDHSGIFGTCARRSMLFLAEMCREVEVLRRQTYFHWERLSFFR